MQKLLALLGAKSKKEFVALLAQFIKFGLVAVSNTAVSMAVYYIFLWISPDLYMVGSVLGTILSIANAFFWNDKFVFTGNANDWRSKLKRLGKTYVSYGGTSILSNVLLWIEVTFFSVSKTIAPIVNLLVTIPLNLSSTSCGHLRKDKRQNVSRQRCGAYPARKSAVSGSLTIIRLNEVGWRCFIVENKTAKYIGKKYGKPGNI